MFSPLLSLPWPDTDTVAVQSFESLPAFVASPNTLEFPVEGGESIRFLRIHEAMVVLAPPATVKAAATRAHVSRAEPIARAIENYFEIHVITGTGYRIHLDQKPGATVEETAFALLKDYLYMALSHGNAQAVADLSYVVTSTPPDVHTSFFELLANVSKECRGGPPGTTAEFWTGIRELHDRVNQNHPHLKLTAAWKKLARVTV